MPLSHNLYTAWLSQSPLSSIWFNSTRHALVRARTCLHGTWIFRAGRTTMPRHETAKTKDANCELAVIVTENDRSVDACSKVSCYTRRWSTERPIDKRAGPTVTAVFWMHHLARWHFICSNNFTGCTSTGEYNALQTMQLHVQSWPRSRELAPSYLSELCVPSSDSRLQSIARRHTV